MVHFAADAVSEPEVEMVHFAADAVSEPGVEMVHFAASFCVYRHTVLRWMPSSRAMRLWDHFFACKLRTASW